MIAFLSECIVLGFKVGIGWAAFWAIVIAVCWVVFMLGSGIGAGIEWIKNKNNA